MKKQLNLVKEFHKKFQQPILSKPSLIAIDRSNNRHRLMKEEVDEYLSGVQRGTIANVAKELADVLYTVYGTILEHGLQDKMESVFEEVHRSNMSKDYGEYKTVKGSGYFKANVAQFFKDKK